MSPAPVCWYSHLGSFGHECGKPAVVAGCKPSKDTKSGVFWTFRCAACAELPGQDNWGVKEWRPLHEAKPNEWR